VYGTGAGLHHGHYLGYTLPLKCIGKLYSHVYTYIVDVTSAYFSFTH
jgi:hypothetical protein